MSKTVMSLRLYARPCRIVKVDLQVGGLNDKNIFEYDKGGHSFKDHREEIIQIVIDFIGL